jgi:CheY-like chemotaxis protein
MLKHKLERPYILKRNILIIEDNAVLSLFAATLVRKLGHAVAGQAQTGEQAIVAALKHSPDLLIISMPLPGPLTAPQTVAHIRARSPLPVIYVLTDPTALAQERARGEALTEYLAKPVAAGEYQSAINQLVAVASVDQRRKIRGSGF